MQSSTGHFPSYRSFKGLPCRLFDSPTLRCFFLFPSVLFIGMPLLCSMSFDLHVLLLPARVRLRVSRGERSKWPGQPEQTNNNNKKKDAPARSTHRMRTSIEQENAPTRNRGVSLMRGRRPSAAVRQSDSCFSAFFKSPLPYARK